MNASRFFFAQILTFILSMSVALGFANISDESTAQESNRAQELLLKSKRVLVLGDSITYSGQYVAQFEAAWRALHPKIETEFINVGLPSETVSGLSEEGHAGGRFPRPDVHERLQRVFDGVKPDLIFVCYGMNCGIYKPYSSERFNAYRDGMLKLRKQAEKIGAAVIHITPPTFDSHPILARTSLFDAKGPDARKPYRGYNEVLDLYSAWLVAQRGQGWIVVNAHTPMNQYLAQKRTTEKDFKLAGDGVHINGTGHWLIAREILKQCGVDQSTCQTENPADALKKLGVENPQQYLKLISSKQNIWKGAWLTKTKHLRPGVRAGLPLDQAKTESAKIESEIASILQK